MSFEIKPPRINAVQEEKPFVIFGKNYIHIEGCPYRKNYDDGLTIQLYIDVSVTQQDSKDKYDDRKK